MSEPTTGPGFADGLVKSKRLGITTLFVSTCFAIFPTCKDLTLQLALVGAATVVMVTYLIGQTVRKSAGKVQCSDSSTTTTSAAK